VRLASLAPVAYQSGVLQHAQVLRHCRLRYASAIRQDVNCLLAVAGQALEDRPAGWIGQSLKDICRCRLHVRTITIWLWVVKSENPADLVYLTIDESRLRNALQIHLPLISGAIL
jgi:hypothetical protein